MAPRRQWIVLPTRSKLQGSGSPVDHLVVLRIGLLSDSPLVQWPTGGHLNLRNHRKMVIADGRRVWTGGRNVADEYLGLAELESVWFDLSCVVHGAVETRFTETFETDLKKVGGRG